MSASNAGASMGFAGDGARRRLFLGCFFALVATAFGFAVRAAILEEWREQFNLSQEEVGILQGVGLYPFAISIILFSLIVDKIGYGTSMVFAFVLHAGSAVLTICAPLVLADANADPDTLADSQRLGYYLLYAGTFMFALGNGVVESVINPVVATVYARNKTHWLNVLHAGWPGGLVLGGLLGILVTLAGEGIGEALPGEVWQWQVGLVLLPTVAYGLLLMGQRFPVQERVAAGASYMDMLREFGFGSCLIVCFLLVTGIDQVMLVAGTSLDQALGFDDTITPAEKYLVFLGVAAVPTLLFGAVVRSFGRPMFVFLLLVMLLLATTELGTDSWIADIMRSVLGGPEVSAQAAQIRGALFLIYTSFIMFVLRFFAGPIVHRISPLGLLATCAGLAAVGLYWLSSAGDAVLMLFLAATVYGFGKTFFWPTTLGVVSEQYPKGGALMLNAIAGVGMLAVGTLGGPLIGTVQDQRFSDSMEREYPALYEEVTTEKVGLLGRYQALDQSALPELSAEERQQVDTVVVEAKQGTLGLIAVLPAIMFLCYLSLIFYFRSKGGYQAQVLAGHAAEDEEFTGGVKGPMEG